MLADRAISDVIADRGRVKDIETEIKDLQQKRSGEDDEDEDDAIQSQVHELEKVLNETRARLKDMEKALGVGGRKRLAQLKGNTYLRLRMNARALKARLRSKVIDHKFERSQLERAYRHQIMRKDML